MNDNTIDLCGIIRGMNKAKSELLSEDGFLESMATMTLEAIRDYEDRIEEIILSHSKNRESIEKIRKLMIDNNMKIKIEKIMEDVGIERLENLGPFSDTILRLLTKTQGEVK